MESLTEKYTTCLACQGVTKMISLRHVRSSSSRRYPAKQLGHEMRERFTTMRKHFILTSQTLKCPFPESHATFLVQFKFAMEYSLYGLLVVYFVPTAGSSWTLRDIQERDHLITVQVYYDNQMKYFTRMISHIDFIL